ncbi:MAG TPA: hypothetical protein VEY30_02250, partial [Myxococcaceae bacterium]|nr:hypothetical protein [Myxococcaceae bacterium]
MANIRSGRVVMGGDFRMELSRRRVARLSQLSRMDLLTFLSEEMSRLVAPVRLKAAWSPSASDRARVTTINPVLPTSNRLVPAEACFLPLKPGRCYSQIEIIGSSPSSCLQEGKRVVDFRSGEIRSIAPADGAYGAVFLIRDDGTVIPIHQGQVGRGTSLKFFEEAEHETLFSLDVQP